MPQPDASYSPVANQPDEPSIQAGGPYEGLSPLQFINVLIRHSRVVVGLPLAAAVLAAGGSYLLTPTFTATTTFVPEQPSSSGIAGSLAGLAGQYGISLGGTERSSSPRFYADLVRTRRILLGALLDHYLDPRGGRDSVTLLPLLRGEGDDSPARIDKALTDLGNAISARVDNQTNVIRVNVVMRYPELAAQVANRLIQRLNEFNAETRQSQARERRKFVESRLTGAETELRTNEETLRQFYDRNRSWQQSPQLMFEEGRLRRQVDIRQEVYLTLKREFETARINEVNESPVITIIDVATTPLERSSPRRRLLVTAAFLFGAIVGILWASVGEYMNRAERQEADEYRRFRQSMTRLRSPLAKES